MTGLELVIVLTAVVLGAIVKSVTGMGLPIIAIPIAALFVDIGDAVVVIALPNLLANGYLSLRERSSWAATRDMPTLVVSGAVGAVGGTILFVNVPDRPLVIALLAAIAAYVAVFFIKPDRHTTPQQSRRWAPVAGGVAGVFQGAIGISGPIVGSWIHSFRLPRGAHILSVTSLFFISGSVQFVILVANGELSGRVGATLLACIPVLASIPIGTRLRDRFSARGFDLAIVGLLIVSSIALLLRTLL